MTERFDFIEKIGSGGMGTVWKARDLQTGDIVAVKMLHPHLAEDDGIVARFEREVGYAPASPNIVQVRGYGTREGIPFIAMEYVEGQSLRELLAARGHLSWEELRPIARDVATALAAAHAASVVHRDVKPSNILITADGTAKLADFGIALSLDMTRLTHATQMGTPMYAAPHGQDEPPGDLYSLGCVLYEALAGNPPFQARHFGELVARHLSVEPDLTPIPREARPLIASLLRKAPRGRPPAKKLVATLDDMGSPSAQLVEPQTVTSRSVGDGSWRRMRDALLGGLAVGVTLLGALLAFLAMRDDSDADLLSASERATATASTVVSETPSRVATLTPAQSPTASTATPTTSANTATAVGASASPTGSTTSVPIQLPAVVIPAPSGDSCIGIISRARPDVDDPNNEAEALIEAMNPLTECNQDDDQPGRELLTRNHPVCIDGRESATTEPCFASTLVAPRLLVLVWGLPPSATESVTVSVTGPFVPSEESIKHTQKLRTNEDRVCAIELPSEGTFTFQAVHSAVGGVSIGQGVVSAESEFVEIDGVDDLPRCELQ